MLDGYPLRRYSLADWIFMILASTLVLQILATIVISNFPGSYWESFIAAGKSVEEVILTISYQSAALGTILSLPLTLLVVYWRKIPLFNRRGLSREESFIIRGLTKEDWQFLVRYIPVSYVLYVIGSVVIINLFGEGDAVNQIVIEDMFGHVPLWQMFLMIVIVAPIVEELFFRGILLFRGNQLEATWLRTILSAVLFGLIHTPTSVYAVYTYVGMGFIFAYAAKRTNTVEASMVYHFLNNLLGFIVIWSFQN